MAGEVAGEDQRSGKVGGARRQLGAPRAPTEAPSSAPGRQRWAGMLHVAGASSLLPLSSCSAQTPENQVAAAHNCVLFTTLALPPSIYLPFWTFKLALNSCLSYCSPLFPRDLSPYAQTKPSTFLTPPFGSP